MSEYSKNGRIYSLVILISLHSNPLLFVYLILLRENPLPLLVFSHGEEYYLEKVWIGIFGLAVGPSDFAFLVNFLLSFVALVIQKAH